MTRSSHAQAWTLMNRGWETPELKRILLCQQYHPPLAMIESVAQSTFNVFLFTRSNSCLLSSGSSSPISESPIPSDNDCWEDLPPRPTPVQARGTTICVMYRKGGKCPRGNACLFKHVLDTVGILNALGENKLNCILGCTFFRTT